MTSIRGFSLGYEGGGGRGRRDRVRIVVGMEEGGVVAVRRQNVSVGEYDARFPFACVPVPLARHLGNKL